MFSVIRRGGLHTNPAQFLRSSPRTFVSGRAVSCAGRRDPSREPHDRWRVNACNSFFRRRLLVLDGRAWLAERELRYG